MVRTRHHSKGWLENFSRHVSSIPQVVEFFRIADENDHLLKVVTRDIASYGAVYRRLIDKTELEAVTSCLAMEVIEEQRPLPVDIA